MRRLNTVTDLAKALSGLSRVRRVLLVSSEVPRGEAFGGSSTRGYACQMVQSVLEANQFEVSNLTLGRTVAKGAEPNLASILRGTEIIHRMGCELVVGVGEFPVMQVSKALAKFGRSEDPLVDIADFISGEKVILRDQVRELCSSDHAMPLALAPTIPCGGFESSSSLRFMDWEKEVRYVISNDPTLSPDFVCYDKSMMVKHNKKRKLTHVDTQFVLAQCIGLLLEACDSQDQIITQVLLSTREAEENRVAGNLPVAFEKLNDASFALGSHLQKLPSNPTKALHLMLANALCDVIPLEYARTAVALLAASSTRWTEKQTFDVQNALERAGLSMDVVGIRQEGLLGQGIPLDGKENILVAAETAAAWLASEDRADDFVQLFKESLSPTEKK